MTDRVTPVEQHDLVELGFEESHDELDFVPDAPQNIEREGTAGVAERYASGTQMAWAASTWGRFSSHRRSPPRSGVGGLSRPR